MTETWSNTVFVAFKRARKQGSDPRRLSFLLLAVVVPPAAMLVWLGVQLLDQERALMAQRQLERQQAAGQTVILSLEQSVSAAERVITDGPLPEGAVRLAVSAAGTQSTPEDYLLWAPAFRSLPSADTQIFADAERLEYQGNPAAALSTYVELSRSPVSSIRAGALLRAARVHRRERRWRAAIAAYDDLTSVDGISISDAPADFVAWRAIGSVLEESGQAAPLARYAMDFETDLVGGRWVLDRASWELAATDIERWLGRQPAVPERRLTTYVAEQLLSELRSSSLQPGQRHLVEAHGQTATVLVRRTDNGLQALVLPNRLLQAWVSAATDALAGARVSLTAPTGQLLVGPVTPGAAALRFAAADTRLPWTVNVEMDAASGVTAEYAARRRLLGTGLVAILLLLGGGSYFLWRVIQRELAIARLQTDFVAAVSHEFRTPLTALRHVTELLEEHDEMPRDRRQSFYDVFRRNTDRLHQLVESLLDFARMEDDRKPYDLRPLDPVDLVRRVVSDFEQQAGPARPRITLQPSTVGHVQVRADAAALTNAVWNLLDNAVKYSPADARVEVGVHQHHAGVAIAVRDSGLGIARDEQTAVFRRFVRGKQAAELGIKGTGLGLAMVAHIMNAHAGDIELDSEPGAGSTFRLVLPVLPPPPDIAMAGSQVSSAS